MRTWLWTGVLDALAVAESTAAVPRGLPSYPFCPANYASNSLGAFPSGDEAAAPPALPFAHFDTRST